MVSIHSTRPHHLLTHCQDIELFDRERQEGVVGVPAFILSRRLARLFLEDLAVPTIFVSWRPTRSSNHLTSVTDYIDNTVLDILFHDRLPYRRADLLHILHFHDSRSVHCCNAGISMHRSIKKLRRCQSGRQSLIYFASPCLWILCAGSTDPSLRPMDQVHRVQLLCKSLCIIIASDKCFSRLLRI